MLENYGIHWFRRDLRIAGNRALIKNATKHQGKVLGLFCFDSQFLSRPDFSHHRFAFFIKTLRSLKSELQSAGGDLLVLDESPLSALKRLSRPGVTISFNRDYEPFARERDQKIYLYLKDSKIDVIHERDHLFFEPKDVLKDNGQFYQVFTPYSKKWFQMFKMDIGKERLNEDLFKKPKLSAQWSMLRAKDNKLSQNFTDSLEEFEIKNSKMVTIPIPNAGHEVAVNAAKAFQGKMNDYANHRDIPSVQGTSRLSLYFKNGSLTVPQVIRLLNINEKTKYLDELIWREFYYSILYHDPEVERLCFQRKYENIKWENNLEWFELWKEGKTGFPIVDAGMRELNQTGWMHNRVRMIVASFLVKDLHIDWKWGEQYFMKKLLDGDLAPNNGGWQWAASTGCDPQPYFRIFNPSLQSERYDPDLSYIKKYVPEYGTAKYPKPIVDHSVQAKKAIELFKSVR